MTKNTAHNVIISLLSFLLALILVEAIILTFDPLGGIEFRDNIWATFDTHTPDSVRRVVIKPGHYHYEHWSFSAGSNGYRITPHTPADPMCTIAMIGDSVTFGFGVNDGETFTALLQDGNSDIAFENMALTGYNAENFESVANSVDVDGYIYLQISNDYQDRLAWTPTRVQQRKPFYGIRGYLWEFLNITSLIDVEWSDYEGLYAGFLERDNLLILTPGGNEWLENEHHAISIEMWSDTVSAIDGHPSAIGHRQLESAMRKYVDSFLIDTCGV